MTDFDLTTHTAEPTDDPPVEEDEVVEAVETAPEVKTKPSKSKKSKAPVGTYVLEKGDSPAIVARRLLGRASLGREIVAANPGVKWREGAEIAIPQDES
jgi:hypothetical protein